MRTPIARSTRAGAKGSRVRIGLRNSDMGSPWHCALALPEARDIALARSIGDKFKVHAAGIVGAAGKTEVRFGSSFSTTGWLLHYIQIVRDNSSGPVLSRPLSENHDGFSYHRKEFGLVQQHSVNNFRRQTGETIPEISFVACDSAVCGWLPIVGARNQQNQRGGYRQE